MGEEQGKLLKEITDEIGYLPAYMKVVAHDEALLRQLWAQTQTGFYRNPLPETFKSKLMLLLARTHRVLYCLPFRTVLLKKLGTPVADVVRLLERPIPARRAVLEGLKSASANWSASDGWAAMPRELQAWILWGAARMILCRDDECRDELRKRIGEELYNSLSLLTSHYLYMKAWLEAHPELDKREDPLVEQHRDEILKEAPEIADLWEGLSERARRRPVSAREKKLVAEIARQDRIREELKRSERRFRQIVNNAPFPVMIYTQDGKVVMINRAWQELSGYGPDNVPTVQAWNALAEVGPADWSSDDVEALDGWDEPIEEGERKILTREGQIRHWEFTTASLGRLADGQQAVMRFASDITQRKELESQLWETNRRMTTILESITDGFVAMDHETRFLLFNAPAEQMLDVRSENALGKKILEVFPVRQETPLYQATLRCLEERTTQRVEHASKRLGRTLDFHLYPSEEGIVAYIQDITRRKQMEQELLASEHRFRRLFESNMVGILFADRFTGAIVDCNDALLRLIGYEREDVRLGRLNWRDLTPVEFRGSDDDAVTAVGIGPLIPYEKQYIHKDGRRVSILIGGAPVEPGAAVVMAYVIDLSAQKNAERHGEEARRLFEAVLRSSPMAIIAIDFNLKVTHWNPAAERIFGWRAQEVLGRENPVIPPERRESYARDARALAAGGVPHSGPRTYMTRNGIRTMQSHVSPIRDGSGKVVAMMAMIAPEWTGAAGPCPASPDAE